MVAFVMGVSSMDGVAVKYRVIDLGVLALPNLLIVMIGMLADVVTNVAMSLITMRVLKNHLVSLFSSWMYVLQWMIWEAHSFVSSKQHPKSGPNGSLPQAITTTRYSFTNLFVTSFRTFAITLIP